MRNFTIGFLCGLLALAGFASSATASATIDLIWTSSGNGSADLLSSGATDTLSVILTAGPNDSWGGGMTVDYTEVAPYMSVIGYTVTPFTMPLPFNLGVTADSGLMVTNINAAGGLGAGQTLFSGASFILGTVTFQRNAVPGAGALTIFSTLTGTDHILNGIDGTVIDGTTTFNNATAVTAIPEPGTISLLGMGLGGLYVVGRRSGRKR
jgi:hypothetical protein